MGRGRAGEVLETVQTVLTALILAFTFRAFFVEAFIIPTGSMAATLLGAHSTWTCPACGWEYDVTWPADDTLCPNCHLRSPLPEDGAQRKAGDRILVHKWPMMFSRWLGPRRWDVIVFRNPAEPDENYIKRLVGLPNETIEIIDGDVFIDGQIARKPHRAQEVLWSVVFDQNHLPYADAASAMTPHWVGDDNPAENGDGWAGLSSRVITYRGRGGNPHAIRFAPYDPRYFQDVSAYNRGPSRPVAPFVNDLRIVGELSLIDGAGGVRFELERGERRFVVELDVNGSASLFMGETGSRAPLQLVHATRIAALSPGLPRRVEFGHVDYRVYFRVDGRELLATNDEDYTPDIDVLRESGGGQPAVLRIAAMDLDLELRGLRVDRDVYYTYRAGVTRRANAGNPFALRGDEYFVLGDNSADSRDSREWTEHGPHLPADYRPGTVPADQIVGPAAAVYLPGLLPASGLIQWRLPDVGRMRFVR